MVRRNTNGSEGCKSIQGQAERYNPIKPPTVDNKSPFYVFSPNDISWIQFVLAFVLLQIPWVAYRSWKKRGDEKIPIFALIAFMYWIYFALSLYWGARTVSGY